MTGTTAAPTRLRIDHGPDPLGITSPSPRLSWWNPPDLAAQAGYQIEARSTRLGTLRAEAASAESILRPWPFEPLRSRERAGWRVRVRSNGEWGEWSDEHCFEVGLLDPSDWVSQFVMHPSETAGPRGERGAIEFRRRFRVDGTVETARIYATALGIYELHLDGRRLGDRELAPGWTAYRHLLEYQTYDVTDVLTPGEHELVATVTDGWYRGSIGITREHSVYGDRLGLLAQLELTDRSGATSVIATDSQWEATASSRIVVADLIEGERVDLRRPFPPVEGWVPAVPHPGPTPALSTSPMPPTRAVERFAPASISRLDEQTQVVDFGVDLNGWVEIDRRALGPVGNVVRLTHGEVLDERGDVDPSTLNGLDFINMTPLGAGQVDDLTSDGSADGFVGFRHTSHGFQYVRITGAEDLGADDVRAAMVHTDLTRTGWFRCSDDRINALHEAAVMSFRGNACEIPTDCPQRERVGWTGDWQIFFPTAAFLYDVAGFTDRWLRDLDADQWPDGRVPNHVPDPIGPAGFADPIASFVTGSAGWGDAATIVPYDLWHTYGDVDILQRQYRSMQRWIEFALNAAASARHATRAEARPEAAPHERFLWDTGFHWGEWCLPGEPEDVFSGTIDQGHVATAYLYRSLDLMARTAELLARSDDVATYAELARQVRAAWRTEFVGPDGAVQRRDQPTLVRAIAFGLLEPDEVPRAAADLAALVAEAGDHLATGFLATPFLLPVLADHGHLDVAYRLLFQDTQPSWLAMIDAGATTIWENWDGVASGAGSLNHYSKGAVVSFLHRYTAGIRPVDGEPGYRRFEIRPMPGGGITSAEAVLDSPYGRIQSAWAIADGTFSLEIEVPSGTAAAVTLPDGTTTEAAPGHHTFVCEAFASRDL